MKKSCIRIKKRLNKIYKGDSARKFIKLHNKILADIHAKIKGMETIINV